MKKSLRQNIFAFFFLSTFLFLRVANAHTFMHINESDDATHCELCEIITVAQQLTPYLDNNFTDTEDKNRTFFEYTKMYFAYEEPLHCIATPVFFHNKPPPVL